MPMTTDLSRLSWGCLQTLISHRLLHPHHQYVQVIHVVVSCQESQPSMVKEMALSLSMLTRICKHAATRRACTNSVCLLHSYMRVTYCLAHEPYHFTYWFYCRVPQRANSNLQTIQFTIQYISIFPKLELMY